MRPLAGRSLRLIVLFAVSFAPILCAYALLIRQSIPIPLLDDYPAVLGFAEHFQQQPTAFSKVLYLAAAQHNEYKLLLVHSLVALELTSLHHLNLSFLIALGNLAPLLLLAVLWRNAFRDQRDLVQRLFLFLPVPFLLFQLNYAEALDWTMPTLQNLGVIAFSLLSLDLLFRPKRAAFAASIAAAVLACSASAGGFLLAPIGALALLSSRRSRLLLVWSSPFVLMACLYAYRYARVPGLQHAGPGATTLFFFSFLGSAYENMHHRPVPYLSVLLGGAFCLFLLAVALRTLLLRAHPFLSLATLFVLGTAALASLGRAGMGIEASLAGRYKIYSDLLLIFSYILIAEHTRVSRRSPRRLVAVSLAVAALLCAGSDVAGYKFLAKRRSQLITGLRQYEASPATASPMVNPNPTTSPAFAGLQEDARLTLTRSVELGLYRLPDLP